MPHSNRTQPATRESHAAAPTTHAHCDAKLTCRRPENASRHTATRQSCTDAPASQTHCDAKLMCRRPQFASRHTATQYSHAATTTTAHTAPGIERRPHNARSPRRKTHTPPPAPPNVRTKRHQSTAPPTATRINRAVDLPPTTPPARDTNQPPRVYGLARHTTCTPLDRKSVV